MKPAKTSKKKKKQDSPALPGKRYTPGEYASLVQEAEAGPYMDGEAFKKKWLAKLAGIK